MTIYVVENSIGSGVSMTALAIAYMQNRIAKRKIINNYLELKCNSFSFDEAMDISLKSTLYRNLSFIAREEQEIENSIKKRPWLFTILETEWRHLPKKVLECDIYYEGRKLGINE